MSLYILQRQYRQSVLIDIRAKIGKHKWKPHISFLLYVRTYLFRIYIPTVERNAALESQRKSSLRWNSFFLNDWHAYCPGMGWKRVYRTEGQKIFFIITGGLALSSEYLFSFLTVSTQYRIVMRKEICWFLSNVSTFFLLLLSATQKHNFS